MFRTLFLSLALCFVAPVICAAGDPSPTANAGIPVQAFFSYSKISSAKISPDGKYLAMVVADDDTGEDRKYLAIIGTDDRKPKAGFKVSDETEIWAFWWANNERVLIATATHTGALSGASTDGALYAINVDQTKTIQLLGEMPEKQQPDQTPIQDPAANFTHIQHDDSKKSSSKNYMFDRMLFIPNDDAHHVLVEGWATDSPRFQALDVDIYSGDVKVVVDSPADGGGLAADWRRTRMVKCAWHGAGRTAMAARSSSTANPVIRPNGGI